MSTGHFDESWVDAPADYGEPYQLPNHPQVGISWYEALAFTRWLTETLRRWPETPEEIARLLAQGWQFTLPSEAEWEKAARGADARIYPWGNKPDTNCANYRDTGIGATSAVGCFPGGASPYRVEELSGNVWEWTRSLWGKNWSKPEFRYPYRFNDGRENLKASDDYARAVRGGAFDLLGHLLRSAFRLGNFPDFHRLIGSGFRVVFSPFTTDH
jgi:formylglycine-generating enzyme required for sulfatase activity